MRSRNSILAKFAHAGKLAGEPAGTLDIGRLLSGAGDYLRDSRNSLLCAQSRVDLAYCSAHALALAAMRAAGYRPVLFTGDRIVIFQALESTAGAPKELRIALDRYHDRRNAAEYEAAPPASEAEAKDLVALTAKLKKLVLDRLKRNHPKLLK